MPGSGDPSIGTAFDPIKNQVSGEGPCSTASGADQAGVATYRMPAVPAPGFTLLGSPTVVADLASTGTESELAARLLDVSPAGTERLVARGLLRPGSGGATVFQLHPQAYRFSAGDVVKLELLPSDAPYARASNAQAPLTVSNLELRLPVREQPGSLGGLVQAPAPKVLPPGYELAAGYEGVGAVPISGARDGRRAHQAALDLRRSASAAGAAALRRCRQLLREAGDRGASRAAADRPRPWPLLAGAGEAAAGQVAAERRWPQAGGTRARAAGEGGPQAAGPGHPYGRRQAGGAAPEAKRPASLTPLS